MVEYSELIEAVNGLTAALSNNYSHSIWSNISGTAIATIGSIVSVLVIEMVKAFTLECRLMGKSKGTGCCQSMPFGLTIIHFLVENQIQLDIPFSLQVYPECRIPPGILLRCGGRSQTLV